MSYGSVINTINIITGKIIVELKRVVKEGNITIAYNNYKLTISII